MFRVAQGKSWDVDTAGVQQGASSMHFRSHRTDQTASTAVDSNRRIGLSAHGRDNEMAFVALEQRGISSSHTMLDYGKEDADRTQSREQKLKDVLGSDVHVEMSVLASKD